MTEVEESETSEVKPAAAAAAACTAEIESTLRRDWAPRNLTVYGGEVPPSFSVSASFVRVCACVPWS